MKTARELHVESHDPAVPEAYSAFMRTGWGDRELDLPRQPVAERAAVRREKLAGMFPGERLVLPAGTFKVRANDTDYKFRPDTAHTYFSGNQTSDAVLVVEGGEAVLYARPRSGARHRRVLPRPPVRRAVGRSASLPPRALRLARHRVPPHRPAPGRAHVHQHSEDPGAARNLGRGGPDGRRRRRPSTRTSQRVVGELRLIKDDWEVAELQEACDITALGFEDSVREWKQVLEFGERWIEGTFQRRARAMGNDIGYDPIVGGGAPRDDAALDRQHRPDHARRAGAARHGRRGPQPLHRRRDPHAAGRRHVHPAAARPLRPRLHRRSRRASRRPSPASPFLSAHNAAMDVLAHGLEDLDLLPVSAEEALDPDSKVYARWTLHGTSHMLGMDVHDCNGTSPDIYPKGNLEVGMVLTVEPGPLLPGGRPAGPRGAARHRDPDRGRHPRHRRRPREPLGPAPPHLGRRRGVDGPPHRWLRRPRPWRAHGTADPLGRLPRRLAARRRCAPPGPGRAGRGGVRARAVRRGRRRRRAAGARLALVVAAPAAAGSTWATAPRSGGTARSG